MREKRRGTTGFITDQRIGLADGARANAIPNVASGEGSHEAAKPEGVIHRYISNPLLSHSPADYEVVEASSYCRRNLAAISYAMMLLFCTELPPL